jgi:glycosyltransferase involved in cell wall biosynthesis
MEIEFLVSTMNRTDLEFLRVMFRNLSLATLNITVINQCTEISPPEFIPTQSSTIKVVSVQERGLSRSRNCALAEARSDICMIADDDCIYTADCIEKIRAAYEELPYADLIVFRAYSRSTGKPLKNRDPVIRRRRRFLITNISSFEISFLRKKVQKAEVEFDERFGLGSEYPVGEENIFLVDCISSGLSVYSYPSFVLTTDENSTGYRIINNPVLRGKVFARMYGEGLIFMMSIACSSIRKYDVYKKEYGLMEYMKRMWQGAKELKRK